MDTSVMRTRPSDDTVIELDELDLRIIELLQQDGRQPYGRVGEAVGLSEPAVRQRTLRLVAARVIRIVAVTDASLLGYRVRATLGIRCQGDVAPLLAELDRRDEADFVVATAGVYDVLAEVQCADEAHLDELLTDLRRVPGVAGIETMVYLRFHKRTYAWPPGAGRER
jgi:Lrp/AsnC family transcriptional regulator for asnA, asnC and gidA